MDAIHATGAGVARLRTYSHATVAATDCTIVEAALATSAAPTFFDPVKICFPVTNTSITCIDRGIGHNNLADLAILEARQIWPDTEIGVLVSIGTGTSAPPRFRRSGLGIKTEINAATIIAAVHNALLRNS